MTALAVLEAVDSELSCKYKQWPNVLWPNVLSISIDEDELSCEVELELIPCVVLLVRYGPNSDDEEDDWDYDAEALDVDSLVYLVSFWAHYEADMRLQDLADRMVTTQRRLEIMSEKQTAEGTPVVFEDLRIVQSRTYWFTYQIPVIARYRALDNHLEMATHELEADSLDRILDEYGAVVASFEDRAISRDRFAAMGAHGHIDRLAINAIKLEHDLPEFLRSNGIRGLSTLGFVIMENLEGHVRSSGWDLNFKSFSWKRNIVKIAGQSLPVTAMLSLPGHPITDVVEHPVLTPDLVITAAWVEDWYGVQNLIIEFDQPRFLFCRDTGRVWEEGS